MNVDVNDIDQMFLVMGVAALLYSSPQALTTWMARKNDERLAGVSVVSQMAMMLYALMWIALSAKDHSWLLLSVWCAVGLTSGISTIICGLARDRIETARQRAEEKSRWRHRFGEDDGYDYGKTAPGSLPEVP